MHKFFACALVATSLIWMVSVPSQARPTRTTNTVGNTTTGSFTGSGGRANSSSSVTRTPVGAKGTGSASYKGRRGGQASGQGSFQGNPISGSGQASGAYKGPRGRSGNGQVNASYNQGTVNSNSSWNRTNPSGQTKSGSASTTYNKSTGGSTTVNAANGTTKTVDLPPASQP